MIPMRQKYTKLLPHVAVACFLAVLLTSCVGIDAKIKVEDSGAGDLIAEYRLSDELLSFGQLDENKRQLPLPLSKTDIEDSLGKDNGLSLKSWSSSKSGKDTVIKMDIAFKSLDALVAYLDPQGALARYTNTGGVNSLYFGLGSDYQPLDAETEQLASQAFAPYTFKLSIEAPKAIKTANSSNAVIAARIEGKTASFSGAMKDIVTTEKAPLLDVSW